MVARSTFPPLRSGMNRIEVVVLLSVLLMSFLLLLPACRRHTDTGARTQSVNNLKQIGLAAQSFHDGNKRLPFNGSALTPKDSKITYSLNAKTDYPASGSWLFQILPYCDQQAMFHLTGVAGSDTIPAAMLNTGVATYMCSGRGRRAYEDGKGPWSDYFINNYVNDPANASKPDNVDNKRTLLGITDGSSNTIFAGHGNIATTDYAKTKDVAGCSNIFVGGTQGTMRGGPTWAPGVTPPVAQQRDAATPADLNAGGWGGPYPQGGLYAWCDGTVKMVSYSTAPTTFGAYLTPTGHEKVELPD